MTYSSTPPVGGFQEVDGRQVSEASPTWQRIVDALAHRALRRRAAGS